jgi:hypothetical protein
MEVRGDAVVFSFPDVHPEARCTVIFQRTLRIPEGGREYPLPPGLGRFPLALSGEHRDRIPPSWNSEEGVFFPMYQSEALWIILVGCYPFAVKVSVGGVNAVTGKKNADERLWRPQDYAAVPRYPWMEWFCVGNGRARQFVALPPGEGDERARAGAPGQGIEIAAHPMRAERYRRYRRKRAEMLSEGGALGSFRGEGRRPGEFRRDREKKEEGYGRGAWDLSSRFRCSAYPVNTFAYRDITGRHAPGRPPTAREYSRAGLPWFECYGADREAQTVGAACTY